MIDVVEISHHYPGKKEHVILNLSFKIEKGDCVGLIGPSGCGKSTLAKIIAGHITPTSGKVFVDGVDVTGKPGRTIFLIHQESDLFDWQTVEKQIFFVLHNKNRERVNALLELVKLKGFEKYYPSQLSGGMKRRLAIARALAVNPRLVILDESFSYLDSDIKESLYRDLREIWKLTKTTILLITHDVHDLENLAQKVISFRDTPNGCFQGIT
ncbi:MAG: ATP-binding cassette domain-containing protein [Candidatus Moraniibacteriota bacterium]